VRFVTIAEAVDDERPGIDPVCEPLKTFAAEVAQYTVYVIGRELASVAVALQLTVTAL
jgi:hypothetical protein